MPTPTPPTPAAAPPPFFGDLRQRCVALGVAVWWFDGTGTRAVDVPAGVSPAVRRAVGRAVTAAGPTPAAVGDRSLVVMPDDHGRAVALLPAGAPPALAEVVRTYHADLSRAEADGRTLDAFSAGLSQSYEEVTFLFRLARLLNAPDDPPTAVDALCRQLLDVVPFGWITLCFRPLAVVLPELRGRTISAGEPPCAEVALVDAADRLVTGPFARPRVLTVAADPLARTTGGEVLAVPVAHDRQCVAVLLAGNRHMLDPEVTSGDMKFLGAVADLLGVFHENMCRFADQRSMSLGTVRSLANAIDAKDPYTRGHSERVAVLAAQLAAATGADPATVERYRIAGLIHDVGKIGVPEAVLCKAGRLTEDEFRLIQKHPTMGVTILRDVPALADVMAGVLHHHERFDGRGYPGGLAGTDIPLIARTLALADTFDAMSSNRSYRAAVSRSEVLAEITRNAGAQFDPALAAVFVQLDFGLFDDMLAVARGPGGAAVANAAPVARAA
jgi:HD-GYP domain-containing protein (c-di-GMP phosphodiesterase class II)